MTSPEFLFYRSETQDFLQLSDPDDWLIIPGDGSRPRVHGQRQSSPEAPFEALKTYQENRTEGILAGWVSYDFARLNPRFRGLGPPDCEWPLVLLGHYSEGQAVEPADLSTGPPAELGTFTPWISEKQYENRIRSIQQLIRRGYLYQLNFSQRFRASVQGTLRSLLGVIGGESLPPHSVYGSWNNREFLSLSPERFLEVDGRTLRTQPIKGTRPRSSDPEEDRSLRQELRDSEKDSAEHVMIVDLERNDLNRVCRSGSVHVPERKVVRSFPTVHHLVSTVQGELRDGVGFSDLLRELFPGGSITGCPKPITLRVIDQLEERFRELYTGTIGYWDRNREYADWNIAIRTLIRNENRVSWDSGGGIVIDSRPDREYRESFDKIQLIQTIRDRLRVSAPAHRGGS
jgi:anthranilate/para-aminobenzoate synthase component I